MRLHVVALDLALHLLLLLELLVGLSEKQLLVWHLAAHQFRGGPHIAILHLVGLILVSLVPVAREIVRTRMIVCLLGRVGSVMRLRYLLLGRRHEVEPVVGEEVFLPHLAALSPPSLLL